MSDRVATVRRDSRSMDLVRSLLGVLGRIAPRPMAELLQVAFRSPRHIKAPPRERDWTEGCVRARLVVEGLHLAIAYRGEGPTVLLVHGWEGRGSQMGALIEPLVTAGFRVVFFDLPAHGQSAGRRTSLVEAAAAVSAVARAVGGVEAVVAHSFGAAATTLALDQGLRLERAVYIAPPDDLAHFLHVAGDLMGLTPEVVRQAQDLLERRIGRDFDDLVGSRIAVRFDLPLLVLHDEEDAEIPIGEAERLVSSWSGAELVRTRGLGHRRILRDGAVLDRIVDFLRSGVALGPAARAALAPASE